MDLSGRAPGQGKGKKGEMKEGAGEERRERRKGIWNMESVLAHTNTDSWIRCCHH